MKKTKGNLLSPEVTSNTTPLMAR